MSGHTPGPWEVGSLNQGPVSGTIPITTPGYRETFRDGMLIASVYGTAARSEANARLIAAAPELLEALVALFNDYKRLADSGDAGFWRLEDLPEGKQALAVIAKATGEQS